MSEGFKKVKLNKADHEKIDKEANTARGVAGGIGIVAGLFVALRRVPWKKIFAAIGKVFIKI